jgi:aspartyl-tRNA(Asn)/glutamyl-tRNA(Gln) amidotransferase subunit C
MNRILNNPPEPFVQPAWEFSFPLLTAQFLNPAKRRNLMVSHEELLSLAKLAKLSIPPEKLQNLAEEMNSIIDFADTINSIPADHNDFDNINGLSNVFREDTIQESLPQEEILKNAQDQDDGCFLVKKRS